MTYISSCQTLSTFGETYILTSSISTSTSDCFTITANSITLDCAGYNVVGPSSSSPYRGIYAPGRQGLRIENCNVINFNTGIRLEGSSSSTLVNNVLSGNQYGVYLLSSNGNTLDGNKLQSNSQAGITLDNSNSNFVINAPLSTGNSAAVRLINSAGSNTLQNNNFSNNGYGVSVTNGANGNIITGNNLSSNNYGVSITGADYTTITGNIISNNVYDGISIAGANYNLLAGNDLSNNRFGLYISSVNYSNVTGNRVFYNRNGGISISTSGYNQIYNNLFNNSANVFSSPHPNYWNTSKKPALNEDRLSAYWAFEEGTGNTAKDKSVNRNDAQIHGATWTAGKQGNGLSFDGTDDYVSAPDSDSLDITNGLTISAWIKPHAFVPGNLALVAKGPNSWTHSYAFEFSEGAGLEFRLENNAQRCFGYYTFVADEWAHVAATWDGATMTVYVDGEPICFSPYSGPVSSNSEYVRIGGNYQQGDNYNFFNGAIDEVKIYQRAMSEEEILEEYEDIPSERSILGGPYLGGNYWSDYYGADADYDGIGDTPRPISAPPNLDYLPLVTPPHVCNITITADTTLTSDIGPCSGDGLVIAANDVTLDCNGHRIQGSRASGSIGISFYGSLSNVVIKNCQIDNFDSGITPNGPDHSNNIILNNAITKMLNSGISVAYSSDLSDIKILNNTVSDTGGSGISLYDVGSVVVDGNSVTNVNCTDTYYSYCAAIAAFTEHSGRDITISNNHISGSMRGILMRSAQPVASGNNILNNIIENVYERPEIVADGYGIYVQSWIGPDRLNGTIVSGNSISNCFGGMWFAGVSHNEITQNTVTGSSEIGLLLDVSSYSTISQNKFDNNAEGIAFAFGSGNTGNLIENNTITNNAGSGISISSPYTANNTIAGNNVTGNYYGVFNWERTSSGNLIYNNYFENAINALEYDGTMGAYWRFDEGSGNVTGDSSINNNDGTLMPECPNCPAWAEGKYGSALDFDGVDDYVIVPQSSSLDVTDAVTLSAWIYPAGFPEDFSNILTRWYDVTQPDRGIVLAIQGGESLWFGVIDDNNRLEVPYSFQTNTWYHVAATWNGSFSKLFVNGVEIGNRTTSGTFTNQNVDYGIGVDPLSDIPLINHFQGKIDELKFYRRVLSSDEISDDYLNNLKPMNYWNTTKVLSEDSLSAYLEFEEGTGSIAYDFSGNNNDGALMPACPDCPQWVIGNYGLALDFDGVNDYVEVPHASSLNFLDALSISVWAKVEASTADHQVIVSKWFTSPPFDGPGSFVLELLPDGITPSFTTMVNGVGNALNSNVTLQFGKWTQIAATYDGSAKKIYVDGQETGRVYLTGPLDTNDNVLRIGSHAYAGDNNWFNGVIDDVKLYSRALTPEEIPGQYLANEQTSMLGGPYIGGNYWSDYSGSDLDGDLLGDTNLPHNSNGYILNGGDYLPLVYCTDSDEDGFCDGLDNCPLDYNPDQNDTDSDGLGDVCDVCPTDPLNDDDSDGICGSVDNCPTAYNPGQEDNDLDGLGDACDNCPLVSNSDQSDTDSDEIGDACDTCTDVDGDDYGIDVGIGTVGCAGGTAIDCDDNLPYVHPNATELCNNIDDDCDMEIDENVTQSCGYSSTGQCELGTQTCTEGVWSDCIGAIYPTDEICDRRDNDCDGQTDEGCPPPNKNGLIRPTIAD